MKKLTDVLSLIASLAYLPRLLMCEADPQSTVAASKEKPLNSPAPRYPAEALQKHWEGAGLLELVLRPDGTVAHIKILKSTGHSLLDQECISKVRRWHFAHGWADHVRLPFMFTLKPCSQVPPEKT